MRRTLVLGVLLFWSVFCSVSWPALIPWQNNQFSYFAKDEKLVSVLRAFCSSQNIDAIISEHVAGTVDGRFDNVPPQTFLDQISAAYNLTWVFDGSMLYIYPATQQTSKLVRMNDNEFDRLLRIMDSLGVVSHKTQIRHLENDQIVFLSGPPKFLDTVFSITESMGISGLGLDTPSVDVFPLQNAWAYDVKIDYGTETITVPGVATTLRNLLSNSSPSVGEGYSVQANPSALPKLTGTGMGAVRADQGQQISSFAELRPPAPQPLRPDGERAASEKKQEGPQITADVRMNAVAIRDTRVNLSQYADLIKRLDVPVDIIEIQAAIVDVRVTGSRTLGTSVLANIGSGNANYVVGNNLGGVPAVPNPVPNPATLVTNAAAGLNFSTLIIDGGFQLLARIQALQADGLAKILQRPSVITMDNVESVIKRDQTFYIKVPGTFTTDLFNVSAGITLKVTPHVILEDGKTKIKLRVAVNDGTVNNTVQVDSLPQVLNTSLTTQAVLLEHQSLLIGGIYHNDDTVSDSGTPWLKNIPILGYLFKVEQRNRDVNERMFIITPRIVHLTYGNKDQFKQYFTDHPWEPEPLPNGNTPPQPRVAPAIIPVSATATAPPVVSPKAPPGSIGSSTKSISTEINEKP